MLIFISFAGSSYNLMVQLEPAMQVVEPDIDVSTGRKNFKYNFFSPFIPTVQFRKDFRRSGPKRNSILAQISQKQESNTKEHQRTSKKKKWKRFANCTSYIESYETCVIMKLPICNFKYPKYLVTFIILSREGPPKRILNRCHLLEPEIINFWYHPDFLSVDENQF